MFFYFSGKTRKEKHKNSFKWVFCRRKYSFFILLRHFNAFFFFPRKNIPFIFIFLSRKQTEKNETSEKLNLIFFIKVFPTISFYLNLFDITKKIFIHLFRKTFRIFDRYPFTFGANFCYYILAKPNKSGLPGLSI